MAAQWNGGNGNWNLPGNWSPTQEPQTGDAVNILTGDPQVTTNVGTVASVNNQASLSIETGGALTVTGAFTNGGTLGLDDANGSGGASLSVGSLTNTSTGTINIDTYFSNGGTSLTLTGKLTNQGRINFGSNSLGASSTVTLGDLDITRASGGIYVTGNTTSGSTAKALFKTGAVAPATLNSTIELVGNAEFDFASGSITAIGSTGVLDLDSAKAQIDLTGQTGNDTALALTSNAGGLYLRDGAALTITGPFSNSGTIGLDDITNAGSSSLTVTGAMANASAGTIYIDNYYPAGPTSLTVTGKFTNQGHIAFGFSGLTKSSTVSFGDLDISSTTGNIAVTGNTTPGATAKAKITTGAVAPSTLNSAISLVGDAEFDFGSGTITAIGSAGSLTLDGAAAQIDVTGRSGNDSALALATNAGKFYLRDGATDTITGSLINSGSIGLDDISNAGSSSLTVTGALTNTSTGIFYIDNYYSVGGTSLSVTGKLTNQGQINFGFNGLQAASTVTVGDLDITAATSNIAVTGNTGSGSTAKATFKAGAVAPATLNSTISLLGDAEFDFASGTITTIGSPGVLTLDGALTQIDVTGRSGNNSALALASNAGGFYLRNGATETISGSLTNIGKLGLDDISMSGGSILTVTGDLTNTANGNIYINNYFSNGGTNLSVTGKLTNQGQITFGSSSLQAASTVTVGGLDITATTGTIAITGNTGTGTTAKATFTAAAVAPATLNSTISLLGDAELDFASGSITAIGATGVLTLDGASTQINVTGRSGNNSALALVSNAGGFYLRDGATETVSGSLTNSGKLGLDDVSNAGGSSLTVTGALTNTSAGNIYIDNYYPNGGTGLTVTGKLTNQGTIRFGSGNLQVASTVTVGDLDISATTSSIAIAGNTGIGATAEATFTTGAVAPTTLNSTISLLGDTELDFASGGISQIGSAGNLTLDGAQTAINRTGSSGVNSGLALAGNAGTIHLEDGAVDSTPGALTNTGTLGIDDTGAGGSSLAVTGALTNTGSITVGSTNGVGTLAVGGAYQQGVAGSLSLGVQGTGTGQYGTLAVTGGAAVGGILNVNAQGSTLAPGTTIDLVTFKPGTLTGMYNALRINNGGSDGTIYTLSGGLTAGIIYDNTDGVIEFDVVFTPDDTSDTWSAGNGAWSSNAEWSVGMPTFYSDVVVAGTASTQVTLNVDATIHSLTLNYSDTLTTLSGTTLRIGSSLSVSSGSTLTVGGTAFVDGSLSNGGSIVVTGPYLGLRGGTTGSGSIAIGATTTVELGGASSGAFNFSGSGGALILDVASTSFSGTVGAFAAGDTIDLAGNTYAATDETVFTVSSTGGTLQILDTARGNATVGTLSLTGSYSNGLFTLASDGGTGIKLGFVATPGLGLAANNIETANVPGSPSLAVIDQYNSDGTLNRVETLTKLGNGNYDFDYAGGSFFNGKSFASFENVVTAAGVLVSQTLYNSSGMVTQSTQYNSNGSIYLQYTLTTLSNGNLDYHYAGGTFFNGKSFASFDNITTAAGVLVSQTLYNTSGKTIQTTQYNANGSVYLTDTVTYPANGTIDYHFAGGTYFNGKPYAAFDNITSASGVLLTQILYNSSGNPTQRTDFNPNGSTYAQTSSVTKLSNGNFDFHFTTGSFFTANPSIAYFDDVTNASGLLLTQTQYNSSGLAVAMTQYNADGSVYLADTASTLSNSNIDYHFAGGSFFNGKSFVDFDNVTNSSGTLLTQTQFDSTGFAVQQTQFNANGSIYLQDVASKPTSGQVLYNYNAGTYFSSQTYSSFTNLATSGGTLLEQELFNKDNSHTFTVPGSNLTIAAAKNDTFNVTGSTDTVRFNATGFGADVFKGYTAGDIFSFSTSIFANYQALSQHLSGSNSAVITDAANDALTLNGVAKSSVNSGMFAFS